jgi:hypothetical protein
MKYNKVKFFIQDTVLTAIICQLWSPDCNAMWSFLQVAINILEGCVTFILICSSGMSVTTYKTTQDHNLGHYTW